MANLAKLKPSERQIEIMHPADDTQPVGLRIGIKSLSDPSLKGLKRRIQDEKLKLEARGKHLKADDIERNTNNLIFAALTGWEWYAADFNGEKPAFNQQNFHMVVEELPWIADQLSTEIGNEKAFFV